MVNCGGYSYHESLCSDGTEEPPGRYLSDCQVLHTERGPWVAAEGGDLNTPRAYFALDVLPDVRERERDWEPDGTFKLTSVTNWRKKPATFVWHSTMSCFVT